MLVSGRGCPLNAMASLRGWSPWEPWALLSLLESTVQTHTSWQGSRGRRGTSCRGAGARVCILWGWRRLGACLLLITLGVLGQPWAHTWTRLTDMVPWPGGWGKACGPSRGRRLWVRITEANFTSVENRAIKRQLFKGCESALQLLAMPSRREWCEGFLPPPPAPPPQQRRRVVSSLHGS